MLTYPHAPPYIGALYLQCMWIIDMYKSHVGVLTKCNKWNIVYTKIAIRKITMSFYQ